MFTGLKKRNSVVLGFRNSFNYSEGICGPLSDLVGPSIPNMTFMLFPGPDIWKALAFKRGGFQGELEH